MNNIIVIGAGMVGSVMAIDLAKKHKVTITDLSQKTLDNITSQYKSISAQQLDVTDKNRLKETIRSFDLVVCAVPGFLGFQTLTSIIEEGKNVVDISFFPEDGLVLDALAKEKNVTAIMDCGVAPGMDNIILGYYNEKLKLTDFECLVGGLPKVKKWPFSYKAPFSPVDVIEEYTRPARYVENFQLLTKPALSDAEFVNFDAVGTLESFNSDGLRSIIHTMKHIPNMKEKTLRYPGHIEYIQVLKESGFFSEEKITVGSDVVSPLDFTSKILFNEWKLGQTEEELTIMRVRVSGTDEKGVCMEITYNLYDEYDSKTQTSSMARTTGFTATAAANLILEGLFNEKGAFPPELVGKNEICFNHFMDYLRDRGVIYKKVERVV